MVAVGFLFVCSYVCPCAGPYVRASLCAAVRAATGLAMKIDENAHDIASLLQAWQLGCMDAVALKTSKFGGLSALRRARDLSLSLGVKMCIEDTWGSDITTAATLHLGAATPQRGIMNVCDLASYVTPRIAPAAPPLYVVSSQNSSGNIPI